MAKKVIGIIKLQLPAGSANPAPPVGPALGQHGVNIMQFCKEYNEKTKELSGNIVPVEIEVYTDRSISFILKSPPASDLIKKAIKIDTAASTPGVENIGEITKSQLEEIAKIKMEDLNAYDIESAIKILAGSARSMGVVVKD